MSKEKYSYRVTYSDSGKPHSYDAETPAIWRCKGDGVGLIDELRSKPPSSDYDVFYMKEGVKHRDGDEPASMYSNGSVVWYKNGKKHRNIEDDYPAYIKHEINEVTGKRTREYRWYKHGKKDRKGEPAVIRTDGIVKWYRKGKLLKTGILNEGELRKFINLKASVYDCSYEY